MSYYSDLNGDSLKHKISLLVGLLLGGTISVSGGNLELKDKDGTVRSTIPVSDLSTVDDSNTLSSAKALNDAILVDDTKMTTVLKDIMGASIPIYPQTVVVGELYLLTDGTFISITVAGTPADDVALVALGTSFTVRSLLDGVLANKDALALLTPRVTATAA